MVKDIILDNGTLRCAEECSARTIVADCVARKEYLGGPLQILYAILAIGNIFGQRLLEADLKLLAAIKNQWLPKPRK